MNKKRPTIKVKFKYNIDTGQIEQFIIDDNAPTASEEYHDKVSKLIAQTLAKHPEVSDAGNIRFVDKGVTGKLSNDKDELNLGNEKVTTSE